MYRIVDRMRRNRASWMTRTDDEILELLAESGSGTPKFIAEELDRSSNYIVGRCGKLVELGLLERPSHGFYTITDDGHDYLSGDLDASDLEDES